MVAYNSNLVPPTEVPRTWDDAKSTKWAGKTQNTVSGGGTPLFFAYLWSEDGKTLNWEKSFSFWTELVRNTRPLVEPGFRLERLAAGEFALFPAAALSTTQDFIARGAPVAIAPTGKVIGDTADIALLKNAPHPNAARLLIDWLTGPEGGLAWSDDASYLSLHPQLAHKSRINALFKSLGLTWEQLPPELGTPENQRKSLEFWLRIMTGRG